MCLIDSIYSTGSHYRSVVNVVNRYRAAHGHNDGAAALLQSMAAAGGARGWAETVADNLKPAHTKPGALLKAEVIQQAAQLMVDHDIDTVEDLVAMVRASPTDNPIHNAWKRLPSQRSGVTYSYLLLLAGLPSVKPDRMVLRFFAAGAWSRRDAHHQPRGRVGHGCRAGARGQPANLGPRHLAGGVRSRTDRSDSVKSPRTTTPQ